MEGKEGSKVIGIVMLVLSCMGVLLLVGYSFPSDKVYGEMNLYSGVISKEEVNPRSQYEKQSKRNAMSGVRCGTVMSKAKNGRMINGFYWMCDGETTTVNDISAYVTNPEGSELAGVFTNGSNIVSIGQLTFQNSNITSMDTNEVVTIRAQLGQDFIVEFYDVDSWWCHAGKTDKNSHTDVVGAKGINEVCIEGYTIGSAKETTVAKLYRLVNNAMVPFSWSELYFP